MNTETKMNWLPEAIEMARGLKDDPQFSGNLRRRLAISARPKALADALEDAASVLGDPTYAYWALQMADRIHRALPEGGGAR